jgi:hypothetical protein
MAKSNPFAGMKLSNQVGLDQRLFQEDATKQPVPNADPSLEEKQSKDEVKPEPTPARAALFARSQSAPAREEAALAQQKKSDSPDLDEIPREDINVTPYISQSFRFTEAELRWLRQQSYRLTDAFGAKISQSTVLRIALHQLWDACRTHKDKNPLAETVSRLKK